jgi:hypothetical protein
VNLVASDGRLVVPGRPRRLEVGPPPAPTPTPTVHVIYIEPTPENPATEPPPADERVAREPVRANVTPRSVRTQSYDATFAFPEGVLRAGPGSGFVEVGDAKTGDVFDVLARNQDGRWLKVRLVSTGVEGWILAETLEVAVDVANVPLEVAATPTPIGFEG